MSSTRQENAKQFRESKIWVMEACRSFVSLNRLGITHSQYHAICLDENGFCPLCRAKEMGWETELDETKSLDSCPNKFLAALNSAWSLSDMLSEDMDRRKNAIVDALEAGAHIWRNSCQCHLCRDAYLRVIRNLIVP